MRLSVVIPVFSVEKDIVSFVEAVEKKVREHTKDYNIIVSTNQEFEYVEKWHERLPKSVDLVAVKLTDDYQQVVMAGVDKADGDATIIITNDYDISLIDTMIEDWKNGRKVVCLRRKHTKFGKIITKIRLKIYNLFLFLFGDIFSIGILKDCQLLDKEIVDKMKGEQDMAHRLRTMYAPLDYNTSVHDISHPIEKFETKGTPQFDFWVGAVGSVIILLAFITCIILGIALSAPIWLWTLFIIFWFIFEFLFLALLVNATAKVKIGILHNVDEFGKIYNLEVTAIPTNKPDIRINYPDIIYKTQRAKFENVVKEIEELSKIGRPVLCGTISIEKSELLSKMLKKKGIKHNVLNAKHHEKEAFIIAQAGRLGSVTIATNMAGRGTDILLGGNPEYLAKEKLDSMGITYEHPDYESAKEKALLEARKITEKEHDEVVKLGGLHVIGTERHESRRIDNQLRGRAARQGDPGSTRFYLSLEDDLMRIFGGNIIATIMPDDVPLESPLISKQIQSAQKKVETRNFDIRKSVLEYDDVINIQREKFYTQRKKVLSSNSLYEDIIYMIEKECERLLRQYISKDMSPAEYVDEDIKLLATEIHTVFPQLTDKIQINDIKKLRYPDILDLMKKESINAYKDHEKSTIDAFNEVMTKYGQIDEPQVPFSDDNMLRHIEKDILLQVVDQKWIDHLNNIDDLKDSIGLVAYGQKDPLLEYKKKAFDYFNQMMFDIQSETVKHIFRVRFGVQFIDSDNDNQTV